MVCRRAECVLARHARALVFARMRSRHAPRSANPCHPGRRQHQDCSDQQRVAQHSHRQGRQQGTHDIAQPGVDQQVMRGAAGGHLHPHGRQHPAVTTQFDLAFQGRQAQFAPGDADVTDLRIERILGAAGPFDFAQDSLLTTSNHSLSCADQCRHFMTCIAIAHHIYFYTAN